MNALPDTHPTRLEERARVLIGTIDPHLLSHGLAEERGHLRDVAEGCREAAARGERAMVGAGTGFGRKILARAVTDLLVIADHLERIAPPAPAAEADARAAVAALSVHASDTARRLEGEIDAAALLGDERRLRDLGIRARACLDAAREGGVA